MPCRSLYLSGERALYNFVIFSCIIQFMQINMLKLSHTVITNDVRLIYSMLNHAIPCNRPNSIHYKTDYNYKSITFILK